MSRKLKRNFSLIEVLIVLFILSFGVLLTGVKVKQLYQEQRFYSDAQRVLSHLMMAQDMMLLMNADVKVNIDKDPSTDQFQIWLEVEKPLKEIWSRRFVERKLALPAIGSWEFSEGRCKHSKPTLHFSLGQMSKGILAFYADETPDHTDKKLRKFEIELPGCPAPLKERSLDAKEERESETAQIGKSKRLYPSEVYDELYANPTKKNEEEEEA